MILEKYQIGAYITAYEDSQAVKLCVHAINNQSYNIKQILIVDNSQKKPLVKSELEADNVILQSYPENIGVAGGFNLAVTWAIAENYDFLWTFDQDSIPTNNCLETLLSVYEKTNKDNYKIGIIAPTPIDKNNNQIIQGAVFNKDIFRGYTPENQDLPYECDAPITSGSLISLVVAQSIDFPRIDLFIDGIDLDYGYCLKQKGFHNIIVPQAIMYHHFGNPQIVIFLNKQLIFQQYSALRHYYICRNHTYLETRFSLNYYKITSGLKRIKYLIFTIIKIILYAEKPKSIKMYACLLGTYHGFMGKLGKLW